MSRALANNSRMIRLPARVHEKVQTVSRIASDLQSDLGRGKSPLQGLFCGVQLGPRSATRDASRATRC